MKYSKKKKLLEEKLLKEITRRKTFKRRIRKTFKIKKTKKTKKTKKIKKIKKGGSNEHNSCDVPTVKINGNISENIISFDHGFDSPSSENKVYPLVLYKLILIDVEEIEADVFKEKTLIVEIEFPLTLETIGPGAFEGCVNLKSCNLLVNVKTIGEKAFNKCKGMVTLKLPNNTEFSVIEKEVFGKCHSLKSIDFSKSNVKTIKEMAFNNCKSLTNITFNDNIENIGQLAFVNNKLMKVILPKKIKFLHFSAFMNMNTDNQIQFIYPENKEVIIINGLNNTIYFNLKSATQTGQQDPIYYKQFSTFYKFHKYNSINPSATKRLEIINNCWKVCDTITFPEKIIYITLRLGTITKKIILVGEVHTQIDDNKYIGNGLEITDFIIILLDKLKEKNKVLDVFFERDIAERVLGPVKETERGPLLDEAASTPPPYLKAYKNVLEGNDTMTQFINFFLDCSKGNCIIENETYTYNARFHYTDIRIMEYFHKFVQQLIALKDVSTEKWFELKLVPKTINTIILILLKNQTDVLLIEIFKTKTILNIIVLEYINAILLFLKTELYKKERQFSTNDDILNKIIKFCFKLELKYQQTEYSVLNLSSRLVDIYHLMRMFQTFTHPGTTKTSNSEYIINYYGTSHIHTYYYFILFLKLNNETQEKLLNKDTISILEIDTSNKVIFQLEQQRNKKVGIKDVVTDGDLSFSTFNDLITDFII